MDSFEIVCNGVELWSLEISNDQAVSGINLKFSKA